jgi:hypothetical protein
MNQLCRSVPSRRILGLSLLLLAANGCGRSHRDSAQTERANDADGGASAAGRVRRTDPPPLLDGSGGAGGQSRPAQFIPSPGPSWPAGDGAPAPGCGTIACRNGAVFKVDFPWTFEVARSSKLTACRNEHCLTGQFSPSVAAAEFDAGVGLSLRESNQSLQQTEWADVTFWPRSPNGIAYVEMHWTPLSAAELSQGDRYTLSIEMIDGGRHMLLETDVMYRDSALDLPLGACGQSCQFTELDLRGTGALGTADDAGAP